jgi:hypothetical protein
MSTNVCCQDLQRHLEMSCEQHPNPYDCPDVVIVGVVGKWFGIPIHDGGMSQYRIRYCPWCGARLPTGRARLQAETKGQG